MKNIEIDCLFYIEMEYRYSSNKELATVSTYYNFCCISLYLISIIVKANPTEDPRKAGEQEGIVQPEGM